MQKFHESYQNSPENYKFVPACQPYALITKVSDF
jgi:hypothetical protein